MLVDITGEGENDLLIELGEPLREMGGEQRDILRVSHERVRCLLFIVHIVSRDAFFKCGNRLVGEVGLLHQFVRGGEVDRCQVGFPRGVLFLFKVFEQMQDFIGGDHAAAGEDIDRVGFGSGFVGRIDRLVDPVAQISQIAFDQIGRDRQVGIARMDQKIERIGADEAVSFGIAIPQSDPAIIGLTLAQHGDCVIDSLLHFFFTYSKFWLPVKRDLRESLADQLLAASIREFIEIAKQAVDIRSRQTRDGHRAFSEFRIHDAGQIDLRVAVLAVARTQRRFLGRCRTDAEGRFRALRSLLLCRREDYTGWTESRCRSDRKGHRLFLTFRNDQFSRRLSHVDPAFGFDA